VTNTIAKTLTAVAVAALLAACGGGAGGSGGSSTSAAAGGGPASTTPSETNAPQLTDQQAPAARLTIDVTIKGGQVDPTNASFDAKVNEPIVVRVNSDAADELHVHSTPDHEFTVEAKPGQQFQFTVSVPGKVDVELHHLNKTIGTITVQ
jgi:ABC-type glycerol-3-phosphate transport system substrate-binding protein